MADTHTDSFHARLSERAVIDRLHQLRVILPAMAQELAVARREAARLRRENVRLASLSRGPNHPTTLAQQPDCASRSPRARSALTS
jgi:hypothetical protein